MKDLALLQLISILQGTLVLNLKTILDDKKTKTTGALLIMGVKFYLLSSSWSCSNNHTL